MYSKPRPRRRREMPGTAQSLRLNRGIAAPLVDGADPSHRFTYPAATAIKPMLPHPYASP
jgi:hypothetical protein